MPQNRVLNGRYHVGERIGCGGMADVYRGTDLRLDRTVAIKMMRRDLARDPRFQARFHQEARNAAALHHPNIVTVFDTGEQVLPDGFDHEVSCPFLVMEFISGHTVKELLQTEEVDVPTAAGWLRGLLTALRFAHSRGLVHRDIKPANVMVSDEGEVKVMDFGIARALTDTSASTTQTQAVVGTAQCLSPEQATGQDVDARSDLYSAGCVAFEMLTGRAPFVGDSPVAVAYQHVREQPPTPSTLNPAVSEALDAVVLTALAKNPDDRFADAGQFARTLEEALAVPTQVPEAATAPASDETLVPENLDDAASTAAAVRAAEQAADHHAADHHAADHHRGQPEAAQHDAGDHGTGRRQTGPSGAGSTEATATLDVVPPRDAAGAGAGSAADGIAPTAAAVGAGSLGATSRATSPSERAPAAPGASGSTSGPADVSASSRRSRSARWPEDDTRQPPRGDDDHEEAPRRTHRRMKALLALALLAFLVTAGALAATLLMRQNSTTAVPSTEGMTQEQAEGALEAQGLRARVVEVYDAEVPAGTTIDSAPEQDAEVSKDTEVLVHVSKGPASVTIPSSLKGMSESEARAELADLGLSVTSVRTTDSGRIAKDHVVDTLPQADSDVAAGSSVELKLSSGKAAVPNVVGMKRSEARSTVEKALPNAVFQFEQKKVEGAPTGMVISQKPAGASTMDSDGTVTLVITGESKKAKGKDSSDEKGSSSKDDSSTKKKSTGSDKDKAEKSEKAAEKKSEKAQEKAEKKAAKSEKSGKD